MDGPYCTVANVKSFLEKKAGTVQDNGVLQILVDGANGFAREKMGVDVLHAARTEYRDGTGTNTVVFKIRPATAVSSVKVGAPGTTRATLVLNTEYVWDERGVYLVASSFARGVQNIELNYSAGYADVPPALRAAVTKMAALRFRELDRLGQTSKALAGETINFDLEAMPKDVRDTINLYGSNTPI